MELRGRLTLGFRNRFVVSLALSLYAVYVNIHPCFPQDSGLCLDEGLPIACTCLGPTGTTCSKVVCYGDDCPSDVTCSINGHSTTCNIQGGSIGMFWRAAICDDESCHFGVTCSTNGNQVSCNCPGGYTGTICTIVDCDTGNPCSSSGFCVEDGNQDYCQCAQGFSGPFCQTVSNALPVIGDCPSRVQISPVQGTQVILIYDNPSCTDDASAVSVNCEPPSYQTLPSFSGEITCTCTNSVGATDVMQCNVDDVPPVCSNTADIAVQVPFGTPGSRVTFTEPTATDTAGSVTLVSTTHHSGDFFLTGETTVTYVYADISGNTVNCTFVVRVFEVDDVPPVCSNFEDIAVQISFGSPGTQVTFTEPTATDNAGSVTLVSTTHQSGDFFLAGETTVTYVYADVSGNTVSCNFVVRVLEVTDPCDASPCANGGTCFDREGSQFICSCAEGFTGSTCSDLVNPCDVTPCLNGGTCFVGQDTQFLCICAEGFSGQTCANQPPNGAAIPILVISAAATFCGVLFLIVVVFAVKQCKKNGRNTSNDMALTIQTPATIPSPSKPDGHDTPPASSVTPSAYSAAVYSRPDEYEAVRPVNKIYDTVQ